MEAMNGMNAGGDFEAMSYSQKTRRRQMRWHTVHRRQTCLALCGYQRFGIPEA